MMGMIVTGHDVSMRAAPGEQGAVIRLLSWDAVEVAGSFEAEGAY